MKLQLGERHSIQCSRARLEHMRLLIGSPMSSAPRGTEMKSRLQRLVMEYMLRQGLFQSAFLAGKESNMGSLLDTEVFTDGLSIFRALHEHSTQTCIAWCLEHKTILRKNKVKYHY